MLFTITFDFQAEKFYTQLTTKHTFQALRTASTHREVVRDLLDVVRAAEEFPDEGVGVLDALGCGQHVEGHGQRTALVYVIHPQLGAGELPLHVVIRLFVPQK